MYMDGMRFVFQGVLGQSLHFAVYQNLSLQLQVYIRSLRKCSGVSLEERYVVNFQGDSKVSAIISDFRHYLNE